MKSFILILIISTIGMLILFPIMIEPPRNFYTIATAIFICIGYVILNLLLYAAAGVKKTNDFENLEKRLKK